MGNLIKRQSSGIFAYDDGIYREHTDDFGDGSINSITRSLDYHLDEVHSYYLPSNYSGKIKHIAMEIFSRNIIFVLTDTTVTFINDKDIRRAMKEFSYDYEYSPSTVQEIFDTGINNRSLRIDFLADVLNIKNTSDYGLFYAKKIKTYLQISNGLLIDYQFDDGLSTGARQLKSVNKEVFNLISDTAKKYRPDDLFLQTREINIQSEAWAMVPGARGNEFCWLHRQDNGGINFCMLMVCHYDREITEEEFINLNFGRFLLDKSWQGTGRKYNCGRFTYNFSPSGELLDFALK